MPYVFNASTGSSRLIWTAVISDMLRNVVNGLRNSCDTADTKSDYSLATANSRESA